MRRKAVYLRLMQYFSTFVVGFEDIVRDVLKDFEIETMFSGAVLYRIDTDAERIGTDVFNNTFQVLHYFKRIQPGALPGMMKFVYNSNWMEKNFLPTIKGANTFRVVASCENEIGAVDDNILKNAEVAIAEETGLTLDRGKPDMEYWFLERSEGVGFFMMRLTYKKSEKRLEPGELRPELSNLLVLLSEPENGDVFLDPFAGSGSIPRARKEFPYKKIYVSDIEKDIEIKAMNVDVQKADATKLTHIADASIDKIVTDPPWGLAQEVELEPLYKGMLKEFSRVLKDGGSAIVLTSRKLLMEKMLPEFPQLKLEKNYNVLVNGKKAGVFKLVKSAS